MITLRESEGEECLQQFRDNWEEIKAFPEDDEENLEALFTAITALVKERELGQIPRWKDRLVILTRLANGTYPMAKYGKTRSRGNRDPGEGRKLEKKGKRTG